MQKMGRPPYGDLSGGLNLGNLVEIEIFVISIAYEQAAGPRGDSSSNFVDPRPLRLRQRRRSLRGAAAPDADGRQQSRSQRRRSGAGPAPATAAPCARPKRGLQQHELAVARRRESRAPAWSLSPAFSRSRTRTRRSRASGASESSIDWFWQTMQRSSRDSVARARLERRIGQDFVGLHREARHRDSATPARSKSCDAAGASSRSLRRLHRAACRAPASARRRAAAGRTATARRRAPSPAAPSQISSTSGL